MMPDDEQVVIHLVIVVCDDVDYALSDGAEFDDVNYALSDGAEFDFNGRV